MRAVLLLTGVPGTVHRAHLRPKQKYAATVPDWATTLPTLVSVAAGAMLAGVPPWLMERRRERVVVRRAARELVATLGKSSRALGWIVRDDAWDVDPALARFSEAWGEHGSTVSDALGFDEWEGLNRTADSLRIQGKVFADFAGSELRARLPTQPSRQLKPPPRPSSIPSVGYVQRELRDAIRTLEPLARRGRRRFGWGFRRASETP